MSEKKADKKPLSRVMQALVAEPWVIMEESLRQMALIAERRMDVDSVKVQGDLPGMEAVEVEGNVAVLPVQGPLFKRANLFTEISGATSSEVLAAQIDAANADDAVDAIVLAIDSPGGQVAGTTAAVDRIRESNKPVTAFVEDMGASGAYWLAAAADEVVMNRSGAVGSVGALIGVRDEEEGLTTFVSSQSPYKRLDKESEDNVASYQKQADDIAAMFISDVAKFRGVSEDKVLKDFGRGGLVSGRDAVKAKMIDRIGTFESVLRAASIKGAKIKAQASDALAWHSLNAEVSSMSENTESVETMADEQKEAIKSQLLAEGADTERARVSAISKLPAEGQDALKLECINDPDCTVEMATIKLMEAMSKSNAEAVEAAKKEATSSVLDGISSAGSEPSEKKEKSEWDLDAELRASFGDDESLYNDWKELEASGRVRNSSNLRRAA